MNTDDAWPLFVMGFMSGFCVCIVFAFLVSNARAGQVCDAAALEIGRSCYYDDGSCQCAKDGEILKLGDP